VSWLLNPVEKNISIWKWRDGLFTESELDEIIQMGNDLEKKSATTYSRGLEEYRNSQVSWIPDSEDKYHWIYRRISEYIIELNSGFYQFDLDHIELLQFTEYTANYQGRYGPHLDLGGDSLSRKLSFSLQLTDPVTYDGGDLQFHYGNGAERAPKARGKIIVFPSFVLHEVTPVTRGVRNSLVGWVGGPQFR
jgi:PKHD-type hydroxylase